MVGSSKMRNLHLRQINGSSVHNERGTINPTDNINPTKDRLPMGAILEQIMVERQTPIDNSWPNLN